MKRKNSTGLTSMLLTPLILGCSSNHPKPDILGDYESIRAKAVAKLAESKKEDSESISGVYFDKHPMYEHSFSVKSLGADYDSIEYISRFADVSFLKSNTQQHLEKILQNYTITEDENRNKITLTLPRQDAQFYSDLENFLESQDSFPPIVKIDVRGVRSFADFTEDLATILEITTKGDTGFHAESEIKSAELRTAQRALLGGKFGVVSELGSQILDVTFDTLESAGFAEEVTTFTGYVISGREGYSSRQIEFPFKEESLQGSVVITTTKYKEVPSYIRVTPKVRDEGWIELDLEAELGEITPSGPGQVPSTVQRKITNQGIIIPSGYGAVINSFVNSSDFAVQRESPPFSRIPVIGAAARGHDLETSTDTVYFLVRAEIVNPDRIRDNPSFRKREPEKQSNQQP